MNDLAKNNRKPRVALYLRVSSEEQAKEGYGLATQEERLRAFLKSQDYAFDEKHLYKDEGYSGTLPIGDRPAMKKLFEAAENKELDIVLVYRLDRFFRKTRLLLEAIDRLTSYGTGFRSITESFDTTNITGRFVTTLLAAVAEMERDTIRERMDGGRVQAAKAGKWVTGITPYGYKYDKKTGKLKINSEEAKWVKRFFEWLVFEKVSLKEIKRRANALKTPLHNIGRKRKTLGIWHERTLGRILTNEAYTGIATYRKFAKARGTHTIALGLDPSAFRPKEDWVEIPVPALISTEMLEMAKKQFLHNREFAARNLKHSYLFEKLIYCSVCGLKFFGGFHTSRGKNASGGSKHYRSVYRRAGELGETRRCQPSCGVIAETRLEPIWEALKEILTKPEYALEKVRLVTMKEVNKKEVEEKIREIDKAIESQKQKKQKLGVVFSEDDSMTYSDYITKIRECEGLIERFGKEKIRLSQVLFGKKDTKRIAYVIDERFRKLQKGLVNASYEQKRKVIHEAVERIILNRKENFADVELELKAPAGLPLPTMTMPGMREKVLLQDSRRRCEHAMALSLLRSGI